MAETPKSIWVDTPESERERLAGALRAESREDMGLFVAGGRICVCGQDAEGRLFELGTVDIAALAENGVDPAAMIPGSASLPICGSLKGDGHEQMVQNRQANQEVLRFWHFSTHKWNPLPGRLPLGMCMWDRHHPQG